jgi:hypothetical protein
MDDEFKRYCVDLAMNCGVGEGESGGRSGRLPGGTECRREQVRMARVQAVARRLVAVCLWVLQ